MCKSVKFGLILSGLIYIFIVVPILFMLVNADEQMFNTVARANAGPLIFFLSLYTDGAEPPPRPTPDLPPRPGMPPRPEPEPEPPTPSPMFEGGLIELRINFDPAWSWAEHPWSEMDTLVQWQDALGNWHDVPTWRGGLDEVVGYEGRKSWWLDRSHFGEGPFRWVLYLHKGGAPFKFSAEFFMPPADGEIVRTRMSVP